MFLCVKGVPSTSIGLLFLAVLNRWISMSVCDWKNIVPGLRNDDVVERCPAAAEAG